MVPVLVYALYSASSALLYLMTPARNWVGLVDVRWMGVPFAFLFSLSFLGWHFCFRVGTLVFLAIRLALPLLFFLRKPSHHARALMPNSPPSSPQTSSSTGLKTRHFNNIISELTAALRIHTQCGSRLGGVSLEFTGDLNEEGYSVTECESCERCFCFSTTTTLRTLLRRL